MQGEEVGSDIPKGNTKWYNPCISPYPSLLFLLKMFYFEQEKVKYNMSQQHPLVEDAGHTENCCNYYYILQHLTLDLPHRNPNLCT